jgi:hypothetical protein
MRRTGLGRPDGDASSLDDHPRRAAQHLALVEDDYFSRRLLGRELGSWDTGDWDADPDWEWHSAAEDTPEELVTLWQEAVARSRSAVTEALAQGGLDQLGRFTWPVGHPACGGSSSI